ncbi:hypothetical protein FPQ18DRAFT_395598 [Pyronema domesticum]|uniref:Similar to Putative ankyrin repeat protein FPV240 acc. no. P14360 n=1 Tax=Pyronema omphalodes (strain CBS 100304) TaxID=1076935 RepID=U4KXB3_PYROM|nr:hypothetical protein FPQ18DRAFT_395598 [Pyronema domesticum]CCX05971.1 Similar to Putative ankyrin repeat protein FPV240; acc. no. P14360 [Pyronema omphalodes CBS 100304]
MHDFVTESKDWVDTTIVHLPTLIHRFLLLVAHAKVPKSMKILVEVTGLNEEWEWEWHGVIGKCVCHFDRHCFDGIVKSYFRELCIKVKKKGLEFLGDSDAITLSHFTVKEYRISEHLKNHGTLSGYFVRDNPKVIATIVLNHLSHQVFHVDSAREPKTYEYEIRISDFYKYCAMNWFKHVMDVKDTKDLNDLRSEEGASPLHFAVLSQDLAAVQKLVNRGANINVKTGHRQTPFHMALMLHSTPILEYLLGLPVLKCGSGL